MNKAAETSKCSIFYEAIGFHLFCVNIMECNYWIIVEHFFNYEYNFSNRYGVFK